MSAGPPMDLRATDAQLSRNGQQLVQFRDEAEGDVWVFWFGESFTYL